MSEYFRPIAQLAPSRGSEAYPLAGGNCWFDRVEVMQRGKAGEVIPAGEAPSDILDRLTGARPAIAGVSMDRPSIMGILNVTPDSFSDGGKFLGLEAAAEHAAEMTGGGADILDIGGESTRPGAESVEIDEEINRTVPVIQSVRAKSEIAISIDTRKAEVARQAVLAGASIINDVSAMSFDVQLVDVVVRMDVPVCLMHAQGDPKTMQENPDYGDVLLDVYDYLAGRVKVATDAGIGLGKIIVDPGIGFGKTIEHNLRILQNLSLFHGLGCPILLGASRKRFIGTIGNAPDAADRTPGSIAVTLAGIAQGVQIHRVHDVSETRQAIDLWMAATGMGQVK